MSTVTTPLACVRGEGQGQWSVQQRPAGVDRRVRFGGQPGRVHLGGDVSR